MLDRHTIDWNVLAPHMFGVMRHNCKTFSDPDDLAQQIVIKFWKNIERGATFVNERAMWGYAFDVYRSVIFDTMRKAERRRVWTSLDIPDHERVYGDAVHAPAAATCDDPRIEVLAAVIPDLPEPHQHVLWCLSQGVKGQQMVAEHPDRYPTATDAYNATRNAVNITRRRMQALSEAV